jgi:MFS family permease
MYRAVFGLSAILAVSSVVGACFVREGESAASIEGCREADPQDRSGVALSGMGRKYWTTLSILSVFSFANSSDTFLLLRASHLGLSGLEVVLAYALYNLTYALFSQSSGRLSDSLGRWGVIMVGWIVYAVVYAGVALSTAGSLWGLFALYGVYMALTEGVSKALIVDCVPASKRGAALGVLYMVLGLCALSSNLLAGYLWDRVGTTVPFWMGAYTALGAVALAGALGLPGASGVLKKG